MADAGAAIAFARTQLGKPYRLGAEGPNSWDCSGLVQAAWRAGGVSLPRTTGEMVFKGTKVDQADLQPGDLVFPHPGHVQLYVGNGMIVEAPRTGEVVKERKMWGFWTARRVAPTMTAAAAAATTNAQPASMPDPASVLADGAGAVADGAQWVWSHTPGVKQLTAITDAGKATAHALWMLTQPSTWLRVGKFVVGASLIGIGLSMQKPVQDVALAAGNLAVKAAAPEAAAAGAAAGKGGARQ